MAIGILSANGIFSSLKKGAGAVTSRFITTTSADQLVLFKDKFNQDVRLNSVTIEANAVGLYVSILRAVDNPSGYDFTGEDVIFIPEERNVTVSGVELIGVKIWGASGQSYYIAGTRF